jgi:ABC-type multidrug transport system fused ATPase/permease subunit
MPYMNQNTDLPAPKTTMQLIRVMVAPYRWQTVLFLVLTFLGIIAWTASPFLVSEIITRLGKVPKIDSYIWWLAFGYLVLRLLDELFWRFSDLVIRSYKPQMIERIRTLLFAATLKNHTTTT